MIRISSVTIKPGVIGVYEYHIVIKENGGFRIAAFRHVAGLRYERIA